MYICKSLLKFDYLFQTEKKGRGWSVMSLRLVNDGY